MRRQRFFPGIAADRPEWFNNYAAQLPVANATLALPAPAVAGTVAVRASSNT